MNLTLKIWRQKNVTALGKMVTYKVDGISEDMSFLEMMDVLNERIIREGKEEPIAFDHDCREGICGSCAMYINGRAHGPQQKAAVCQLHMRSFHNGDTIYVEPWRAKAFPVIKDLCVDRQALDRIVQAGGFISVNTGSAPDANEIPIPRDTADQSMDAASCIGCGACVAACKNGSAMLFVAAHVSKFALLPQGKAESSSRAEKMVAQMDIEGFGACSNTAACTAECPKAIGQIHIARLNREYLGAKLTSTNV